MFLAAPLLPSYGAIVTAIGAVLGFFATLRGQLRERQSEGRRRFDEYFNSAVENLGSTSQATRAGAAVSLMTFLRPEYEEFHEQVLLVTVADLKIATDAEINRLLVRTFERAMQARQLGTRPGEEGQLDLSQAHLDHASIPGVDLQGADIAFASMQHTTLRGADLTRARGYRVHLEHAILSGANLHEACLNEAFGDKAQFHNARMSPAWLEGAKLRAAQFQGARMQSAHLEKSVLKQTRFEGADLVDTYFCEATIDDETLETIVRADNWEQAHFDEPVRTKLKAMTGREPARCRKSLRTSVP